MPSSSATSSVGHYATVFSTGSNINRTHRRCSRSQKFPSWRAPVPQRSLLSATPFAPAHSSAASASCCCCELVPLPIVAAGSICCLQPHPAGHLFHLSSFPCISTTRRFSTHAQPPSFPPAPVAGQCRCLPCSQLQPPLGAPHADATASSLSRCRSPRRTAAALTFLQSPLLPAAKSSFPPFLPLQSHVAAALSLGRLFLRPPLFLSSLCCCRNLLLDRCPHSLLQKTVAVALATATGHCHCLLPSVVAVLTTTTGHGHCLLP
ncbi:hypothetical protein BHM03_00028680 [Ensete ventricosum]|nr:hypothetical protein BHM03_00028680 [Ensete ventricosum]